MDIQAINNQLQISMTESDGIKATIKCLDSENTHYDSGLNNIEQLVIERPDFIKRLACERNQLNSKPEEHESTKKSLIDEINQLRLEKSTMSCKREVMDERYNIVRELDIARVTHDCLVDSLPFEKLLNLQSHKDLPITH